MADAPDEEAGTTAGLLGTAARRSHDDEIADRTREEWLKYAIVYVLSSATFWLFAIFLVLVDLAIFAWQVIYKDDHRLHILEVFIAGIFLVELLLRAYAFDLKSLVSCIQVLDACVVVLSFSFSLMSINNPFLVGRSARMLLLLRGTSRVSRALSKSSNNLGTKMSEVELRPQKTPDATGSCRVSAVTPVYLRSTPHLQAVIDELLEAKKLSDDHRLTLSSCREESYRLAGAQSAAPTDETRVNHVVSLAALDVLRQHRSVLLRSHPDGLSGLLRGSGLMFPKRSL